MALEWLPFMYPPALFDMRDKDGTMRRLTSSGQLPFHPHGAPHGTSNSSHHPHHATVSSLLSSHHPKHTGLYHPSSLLRHMSMSIPIGEPAPQPSSFSQNVFIGAAATPCCSSPSDPHSRPFDLSKAILREDVMRTKENHDHGYQTSGRKKSAEAQPLDLRVVKKRKFDENQNVLLSPQPPTPPMTASPPHIGSSNGNTTNSSLSPDDARKSSAATPPLKSSRQTMLPTPPHPFSVVYGGSSHSTTLPTTYNGDSSYPQRTAGNISLRSSSRSSSNGPNGSSFPFSAQLSSQLMQSRSYHDVLGKFCLK